MDPNHLWHVPLMLPAGDPSAENIYSAVGLATTKWEMLEYQCSLLYAALLNSKNKGASDGYGKIAAFKGRKELIQAAIVNFRFATLPGFRRMKEAVAEVDHFSVRRNEIAHGVASQVGGTYSGYYLIPASYATNKRSKSRPLGASYAFTASQIRDFVVNFERLTDEIDFWVSEVKDSWLVKYEGWPRPITRWHSPATQKPKNSI